MTAETQQLTESQLIIWPKRLLYLAFGCCVLALAKHMGWTWKEAGMLMAPLLLMEGVFRLLVSRRLPGLQREILARLQAGAAASELLSFYNQQIFLRFAAPRYAMQGLLGLIHSTLGQHRQAAAAYEEALEEAPGSRRFPLAVGLGDSLYELGKLEDAEEIYRESLDEKHTSSRACANLARIIRDRGGELQEAEIYLRQALEMSRKSMLRGELVELLAAQGKGEEADWELQVAEEELGSGSEEERACLQGAREAVDEMERSSTGPA